MLVRPSVSRKIADLAELRPLGVDGLGHVVGGAGFLQAEMVAVAAVGGERQRPPELPVDLLWGNASGRSSRSLRPPGRGPGRRR